MNNNDNNHKDNKLLLNIRELCNEIHNLTKKLEDSPEKTEIKNKILTHKYKILILSEKPPVPSKKNENVAGAPSEQQKVNSSQIYWQNSLRSPYFF
jgi:hypothetical protein